MYKIYMDLDDTLIQTQMLFEKYKRACTNFILIEDKTDTLAYGEVLRYFDAREIENIKLYGFKNERFIMSWKETYRHFHPEGDFEDAVGRLAETVFFHTSPLMKGAIDVLEELTEKGYELTIITVGVEEVQHRRIDQAGIRHYFKEIHVVPYKNKDVFASIITDLDNSVMVGNSMRSDINPSLELGIPAIHVDAPNWFHDIMPRIEQGEYYFVQLEEVPEVMGVLEQKKVTVGNS